MPVEEIKVGETTIGREPLIQTIVDRYRGIRVTNSTTESLTADIITRGMVTAIIGTATDRVFTLALDLVFRMASDTARTAPTTPTRTTVTLAMITDRLMPLATMKATDTETRTLRITVPQITSMHRPVHLAILPMDRQAMSS